MSRIDEPDDTQDAPQKSAVPVPAGIQSLLDLASRYSRQQRYDAALETCRRAIAMDRKNLTALRIIARIHYERGDYGATIDVLTRALRFHPDNPDICSTLGSVYLNSGNPDIAETYLRKALGSSMADSATYNNLGYILQNRGNLGAALECYRKATDIQPANPDAIYNTGIVQRLVGDSGARDSFRQVLRLNPLSAPALNMLGVLEQDQGNMNAAARLFQRALACEPQLADAHRNLAHTLLARGEFSAGWDEYEWRQRCPGFGTRPGTGLPCRQSGDLRGKRVWIRQEQGIGDEVMFTSCLPDLLSITDSCYLSCDARLVTLFQRSFPGVTVLNAAMAADRVHALRETIDHEILLGSLPRIFRQERADFGTGEAYLVPSHELRSSRRRQLKSLGDGLRIGISWRGGADPVTRRQRATALAAWCPVLRCPDTIFVNLQYGECAQEIEEARRMCGVAIHELENFDPLKELDDFAACIAELDLVISIDNATVHFAGALGVPAWTLLPCSADWRWFEQSSSSLWYHSIKLFRQTRSGNWTHVLNEVAGTIGSLPG